MAVQINKRGLQEKEKKNVKIIVLDAKDDEVRRTEAKGMMDLTKLLRESKFNINKIVMALHDSDTALIYPQAVSDGRHYAVIQVYGDKDKSDLDLKMKVKLVETFLVGHKYKSVGSRIFTNKEYPAAKIVVKLP